MNFRIFALACLLLLSASFASYSKYGSSATYWSSEARPFGILGHMQTGPNFTVVLKNMEAEPLYLIGLNISDQGFQFNMTLNTTAQYFQAGETKNLTLWQDNGVRDSSCIDGNTYEYQVTFTYKNSSKIPDNQHQYGVKTLVGKCGTFSNYSAFVTADNIANAFGLFTNILFLLPLLLVLVPLILMRNRVVTIVKMFEGKYKLLAAGGAFMLFLVFLLSSMLVQFFALIGITVQAMSFLLLLYFSYIIGKSAKNGGLQLGESFLAGMLGGISFAIPQLLIVGAYLVLPTKDPSSIEPKIFSFLIWVIVASVLSLFCGIVSAVSYTLGNNQKQENK